MEKIFLVEDEIIVREGIKNNIDWKANGYEFVGEARDGELAFPLIQKYKPDIVITDIKMPFMDGIELSRLVKEALPSTEIIILSGYEEFEYAKQAISNGVAQYLTKPISAPELLKEIDKVALKIREKKQESLLLEKYQNEMKEKRESDRADLFRRLVSGNKSMGELIELAKGCELDISAVKYNIMLFQVMISSEQYQVYSDTLLLAEQRMYELCENLDVLMFDRANEGKAFLIKADGDDSLLIKQESLIKKIEELLSDYNEIRYYGGIGEPVDRMTELRQSFITAQRAFAQRFFVNENKIENAHVIIDNNSEGDDFNLSSVSMSHVDTGRIEKFLKTGSRTEIDFFMDEFASNTGDNFMKSLLFRQYIVMDVYFCVMGFVESLGHDRKKIEALEISTGILNNAEDSWKYIARILDQAISIRENSSQSRYKAIKDEAISYIESNYADTELSLNSIASHINISPNHLSMIFSQETGGTLIKYITDYRLGKAKELLRCTSKRSSEICEEVGYNDSHYFSYLFKKTTGMTPTQYRESNE